MDAPDTSPAGTDRPARPALIAADTVRSGRPGRLARPRYLFALALLVLLALLLAYARLHGSSTTTYQTLQVDRGTVRRTVTASGTINPVTTIQVGTYVSGVIQSISCDFNTRVKAGQRCARIDPSPYQSIVDQNEAALATARAQLTKDQANLDLARLQHDRASRLLAQHMVAQDAFDTALNTLQQAAAQIEVDQAAVAQRAAAVRAARVNLAYTDIVSPVDGTVVSRNVTPGQTVAASFQTPTLFLIATDLTQMQVDTSVSESDIGRVALGDKVQFTVEAYPERSFSGQIVQRRQAPQSVQNVITYDAVAGVANADLALMPGMTAAVRIVTAERHDVLRVPDQALRFSPTGAGNAAGAAKPGSERTGTVWRLQDGRPVPVPLVLGLDDDTYTEVLQGPLQLGDAIIIGETRSGTAGASPRLPGP